MRPNLRRLAGTLLLLGFVTIYVLLAMVFAAAVLPAGNGIAQFLYYAVAGLAWVPPAGLIIQWMHKPSRADRTPASGARS